MDARYVVVLEHGRHGLDRREELGNRLDVLLLQHAGLPRRRERVVRDGIPGAKNDVLEVRERDKVLDQRRTIFGPLPQPDGRGLRYRADRLRQPAADTLDSCDERRGHGAKAGRENTELT